MEASSSPLQEVWAVVSVQTVGHTAPALLVVMNHLNLKTQGMDQLDMRGNDTILDKLLIRTGSLKKIQRSHEVTFLVLGLFREDFFPGSVMSNVNFNPSPGKSSHIMLNHFFSH